MSLGRKLLLVGAVTLSLGCSSDPSSPDELILNVPETERWKLPGLRTAAYVVRTEGNVPHIYAETRNDLARVEGFVLARDRFFMMDLSRRLGLGTLSELFGDVALTTDQESRGIGIPYVADRILEGLTPELAAYFDSYAAGVNAYIAAVERQELEAPSELELAKGILGSSQATDLMQPFDRRGVAAMMAVILYETSYETDDVGTAATAASLDGLFEGAPFQELRRQGTIRDIWERIEPIFEVASAGEGFRLEDGTGASPTAAPRHQATARAPRSLLKRTTERLTALKTRLLRNHDAGFGSNAWAVSGSASKDGSALIAGDGHLQLSVPSILYRIGLDTRVFGDGDTHQLGLLIPGMTLMAIGSNGRVGWSQTQLMGDVTDWYVEELRVDAKGAPIATIFKGEVKPLVRIDEDYEIADLPVLGSVGRSETWARYVTFDGRFIADVEGRDASPDEELAANETLLNLQGDYVVPGDEDGDGVISAISFDYGGFDAGQVVRALDALGHTDDVHEFREATRGMVSYSQNFAVADHAGNAYYTSYQALPCRKHLPRTADGSFEAGADPTMLIDGTRYGAFTIPTKEDGRVDESAGADDPSKCVVPHATMPASLNPERGYVLTANNDPGGLSFDNSLTNDDWYIGGPWDAGFRADTIDRELSRAVAQGEADIAGMAAIQGNVDSRLGELFADRFLKAIDGARDLSAAGASNADEQRIVDLYESDASAVDEATQRVAAWRDAGFQAKSGVKTYYDEPDAQALEDAVATTIFNAWIGRVVRGTFDDEQLPGVWRPGGNDGRLRALDRFLDGRGSGNPLSLASWNEETGESIFFDVLDTAEVETSTEVILAALVDSLAFLRGPADEDDEASGGYGTDDMSQWLWGMRHYVRFESLLADFLGDDSDYAAITNRFAITVGTIQLDDDITAGDPRQKLEYFPRDGEQDTVDAANSGLNGTRFSYSSGPVMRMVIAFDGEKVVGQNIIPGGQSGLVDSPFFSDQAELWLANQTTPMRFSPADVAAHALGRETFIP